MMKMSEEYENARKKMLDARDKLSKNQDRKSCDELKQATYEFEKIKLIEEKLKREA